MVELVACLESPEPDVGHAVPEDLFGGFVCAVVGESRDDAAALGEEPGRDVLGQNDLDPDAEPEGPHEKFHLGVVAGADPILRNLGTKKINVQCWIFSCIYSGF